MPSVGTLNLEVQSNAGEVGGSLKDLAGALERIRKAVPENGLGLSGVASEVSNFITEINKITDASKAFKSIEQLGNGLKGIAQTVKYSTDSITGVAEGTNKVVSSINTQPLVDAINTLKEAIGTGFNIGMAGTQLKNIREALNGDWNTGSAQSVGEALKYIGEGAKAISGSGISKVAKDISSIAHAMQEYADASERMNGAIGADEFREKFSGLGGDAASGYAQGIRDGKDAVSDAAADMTTSALDAVANTQRSNSPALEFAELGSYAGEGYIEGIRSKITDVTSEIAAFTRAAISSAKGETSVIAKEVSDAIRAAFSVAISSMNLSDAQKNILMQGVTLASDFANGFIKSSKAELPVTGKILADAITSTMSVATEKAFSAMKPLNEGLEQVNSRIEEAGNNANASLNVGIESAAKEAENLNEYLSMTNEELQEQLQKRREILDAQNQARLEGNYSLYRELYMSGEGDWKQQVPEMYGFTQKAIEENETYADALKATMKEVDAYVDAFIEKMNTPTGPLLRDALDQAFEAKLSMKQASESASTLRLAPELSDVSVNMQQVESATQTMNNTLGQAKTATRVLTDEMAGLDQELKQKKPDALSASDGIKKFNLHMKDLRKIVKKSFPLLSELGSKLKNIIVRRTLTAAIRKIVSGAKEGLQNVYEYSKAVGTSFAPSMDSAASSLATMKNALGAALAPAVQALIPLLQSIVNGFIQVVNWANQFFALLNGQKTWTRALPQTAKAFEKQEKAAKKAGAAVKDLLADWDELNIIQSNTSGAGGAGDTNAAENYLTMFEEVDEFNDKIKGYVKFAKENFGDILKTAIGIKGAMLAWRFSTALAKALPFLSTLFQGLTLGATIGLTVAVTDLTGKAYADTGEPAWLIADALAGAVGSTIARGIATRLAGGVAGSIAQGFTLILAGAVNIKNAVTAAEQEKDAQAWMLAALGSVEAGIGAAIAIGGTAAGSLLTGLVVTVAAMAIAVPLILEAKKKATYRKMALDTFAKQGANGISPEDYLRALQTRLTELTSGSQLVIDASLGLDEHTENFTKTIESLKALNALVGGEEKLSEEDANKFNQAWDIVIEELGEISKINYQTIYAGLDEAIANGSETLRKQAIELRTEAIRVAGMVEGARGKLKKELEFLENEIMSGTDDQSVLDRYEKIYKVLAKDTEDGLAEFRAAIENGTNFDFSGGESGPVQAAVDFINSMNTDTLQPALDKVEEQYNTEVGAVENALAELKDYLDLGEITEDQYKAAESMFNRLMESYQKRYEEQVEEITGSKQSAFNTILEQALSGYYELDQDDEYALKSYTETVFDPLVKAIEAAGGEVPDKIKAIVARDGKNAVNAAAAEIARAAGREGIYESFFDDFMNDEIVFPVDFIANYELELVGNDPSKIIEEEKKDIINNLFKFFDPNDIFRVLNEKFGWSVEDIIGNLNLDSLDLETLQSISDYLDKIREAEEAALLSEYNTPNSSGLQMSWSTYQEELVKLSQTYDGLKASIQTAMDGKNVDTKNIDEKTSAAAAAYEGMAARISKAIQSLDGLGFVFGGTLGGIISAVIPKPRAMGGPVKSGDLVMANENGNFEMMGRMGNQPVVANNQQIVAGITSGVSQANEGVESRLTVIEGLLTRILSKEFVAKAVPSASWGSFNNRSNNEYGKVTGV